MKLVYVTKPHLNQLVLFAYIIFLGGGIVAFCNNCDSKLIPGAKTCASCGKPVNENTSEQKKSSSKIILPIIGILILIGIIVFLVLYALKVI